MNWLHRLAAVGLGPVVWIEYFITIDDIVYFVHKIWFRSKQKTGPAPAVRNNFTLTGVDSAVGRMFMIVTKV